MDLLSANLNTIHCFDPESLPTVALKVELESPQTQTSYERIMIDPRYK